MYCRIISRLSSIWGASCSSFLAACSAGKTLAKSSVRWYNAMKPNDNAHLTSSDLGISSTVLATTPSLIRTGQPNTGRRKFVERHCWIRPSQGPVAIANRIPCTLVHHNQEHTSRASPTPGKSRYRRCGIADWHLSEYGVYQEFTLFQIFPSNTRRFHLTSTRSMSSSL